MHASWIKFKMDDVVTHWCIECDLSYRCKDEFSKHYNQIHRFGCDLCKNKSTHNMLLENHIENHHKPDSVPTVVGRDKKHVKENNEKEAKDDNSTRSAKPRKQEQDDSISVKEEMYMWKQ